MKNLIQRTITGSLFVSVIIGSILIHPFVFVSVMAAVSILGLSEYYSMITKQDNLPDKTTGIIVALLTFTTISLVNLQLIDFKFLLIIPAILFLIPIFELFRNKPFALNNIATGIFGILYIIVPLSMMSLFYFIDENNPKKSYLLISFFILLWSNDTFAYLFGMSLGKRRLFERVSPKKSWEGFIGGLISTTLISFLLSTFFSQMELWQWLIYAIIIVLSGTLGDLTESLLKRNLNIKDTGSILPGHGGILDRFDAVLISIPFVTAFLLLIF